MCSRRCILFSLALRVLPGARAEDEIQKITRHSDFAMASTARKAIASLAEREKGSSPLARLRFRVIDSSINMNFRGRTHLIILRERAPPFHLASFFLPRSLFPFFIFSAAVPARGRRVNENVTKICIDSAAREHTAL